MTIELLESEFVNIDISLNEKKECIFEHQLAQNSIYNDYVGQLSEVDFLGPPPIPIDVFKQKAWAELSDSELVFRSSGTGGTRATHPVRKALIYQRSIENSFKEVFGQGPFTIANHLPGYVESGSESSLLYMVGHLNCVFGNEHSGSFLGDPNKLLSMIEASANSKQPLLIFGAAFGLLDFVENNSIHLPENSIVVETGGMKTYRKEVRRNELHQTLATQFKIDRTQIFSEYGMCELLSQSYTRGGESFCSPPWLEISIVDPGAPWRPLPHGEIGAIAVFDCANLHSLSSLLTGDRGRLTSSGFEVLGRLQNSELRGCNFLIEQHLK